MARYLFFVSELYAFAILRPLQAAIRARAEEVRWFFERADLARFMRVDELQLASVRDVRRYKPDAVFVPGNWVPDYFPGLKVEIFHGFNVSKRSDERGHFRVRGWFDLYCTQGPATTAPFRELAIHHGYFRVAETGWPKLDPLFSGAYSSMRPERPTVLYASTFTERISSARTLRDEIARLAANGEWHWLLTLHPKMAPDVVASYRALEGGNVEFVETDDILQLYARAQVMLSDTSSVVPEFLTQHKPVVTFRNTRPGPHLLNVERIEDVEAAIRTAFDPPTSLRAAITEYAQHIHPYRDGRSSERVLDATQSMLERGRTGLKRKPLNLGRRLQARARLGYWGL